MLKLPSYCFVPLGLKFIDLYNYIVIEQKKQEFFWLGGGGGRKDRWKRGQRLSPSTLRAFLRYNTYKLGLRQTRLTHSAMGTPEAEIHESEGNRQ